MITKCNFFVFPAQHVVDTCSSFKNNKPHKQEEVYVTAQFSIGGRLMKIPLLLVFLPRIANL